MKFTSSNIETLQKNEVFVFGSNLLGRHGSGAARIAYEKFGAIWGKGVGMQGQSYAIPTMEVDIKILCAYISDFLEFARTHPERIFLITRIGCGIAGYKDEQIAPMFKDALHIQNIILPKSFVEVIQVLRNSASPKFYPYTGMKYCKDMVCHICFGKNLDYKDFVFFWKDEDDKSYINEKCLSQWYNAPFAINNQWYSCAEQYMMAEKARLFGDYNIQEQIIMESDQLTIKRLGRRVHNFKEEVWIQHRYNVIKQGNLAKFSQNAKLKQFLMSTCDKILVEASPHDVIYGVGLEQHMSDILNPHKWRGLNLLGFTLMEVRDLLRS